MDWSFQLYSARNFPALGQDPEDARVKSATSRSKALAASMPTLPHSASELDANGLSMPSGHFSIDLLENDFDGAAKIAKALGVQQMICPHIGADARPTDAAGWQAFGKRLGKVGDNAKKAGFDFAWHNHDFEFKPLRRRLAAAEAHARCGARHRLGDGRGLGDPRRRRSVEMDRRIRPAHHRRPRQGHRACRPERQ